jgi:hypothetical protein
MSASGLDASRYGSGERADPVLGEPRRPGASKSVDTGSRALMGSRVPRSFMGLAYWTGDEK